MEEESRINQWKERFNESCFFSTEMSSRSNIQKDSPRDSHNLFRISSKFKDEPKMLLEKAKQQQKEASNRHLAVLRNTLRTKSSAQKAEKEASICRYEFIKLYHNKKFRLEEEAFLSDLKIDNERAFRQSVERFRDTKWNNEMSVSLRKENQKRKLEELKDDKTENEKVQYCL